MEGGKQKSCSPAESPEPGGTALTKEAMDEKSGSCITEVQAICDLDSSLWEVTKGLPVRTGTILRISEDDLPAWGVRVNDENRSELALLAEGFRLKDYKEKERNANLEMMEKTQFSLAMRSSMSRVAAYIVKELLASLDDGQREFTICDLAAGTGGLATAIATALRSDPKTASILDRAGFSLVDYSSPRLHQAKTKLDAYRPAAIRLCHTSDEEHLAETQEKYDIITSLSHLHKKPFRGVLASISGGLAEGGALVSGDWHSSLTSHPLYVYQLFEKMGVDAVRLNRFREILGDKLDPYSCPDTTFDEIAAIAHHQDYWAGVYFNALKHPGANPAPPRLYFLGAFDTTRKRVKKLEDSGLCTDMDTIRAAFPKANLPQLPKQMMAGTDRASIIVGVKCPRRG